MGGYERSSTNGCVQGFDFCIKDDIRINALSNAAQDGEAQFFFSDTLAQTFNKRCSALTGAAITVLALAEPFIAAGAAVGLFAVIYCFLKALMVSSYRLGIGTFFLQKKVRPPRLWAEWNYTCLVGTTKHKGNYVNHTVTTTPLHNTQHFFIIFVISHGI